MGVPDGNEHQGLGLEAGQLERLLGVGRSLVTQLDLSAVLDQVLEAARDLTGAQYAALGILDEAKTGLEQFLVKGIDEEARTAIGDLPRGRGVLGEIINNPRPLRLPNVGEHPRSFGFPPGHPPMTTFLGTPIKIRDEVWGNLYLTDKAGGADFTEVDEELAVVLSEWAAIGIANARLYSALERRQVESEKAIRGLEASASIARAVGGETDLERVLELIVKRGRALLDARVVVILVPEDEALIVASAGGEDAAGLVGTSVPLDSLPGEVLSTGSTERVSDIGARVRHGLGELGAEGSTAILTPLMFRTRPQGVLIALDRAGSSGFDREDQQLFEAFAASAAVAIATARSVESDKLHLSIETSEQERRRWARELHDETLQELGGLKVMLETARSAKDDALLANAIDRALSQVDGGIQNLQALITELRPPALDELGLEAALEALVDRVSTTTDLSVEYRADLGHHTPRSSSRLAAETEGTIYRLVQESLNNVIKHAGAGRVVVRAIEDEGQINVEVTDDGSGFDPEGGSGGFGLVGMRERITLIGGELEIRSARGEGTSVRARVPARRVSQSVAGGALASTG